MTTRQDVSSVPLQGGYVAKLCPVRAQNDALLPVEPLPPSPVLERRFERGRQFEAEIVAELLRLHPEAVVVEGENSAAAEAATASAMAQGDFLILNSRLPADQIGRRVGKPDLLVAAAGGGYRGVDVKHHMTLEPVIDAVPGGAGHAQRVGKSLDGIFSAAYDHVSRCECGQSRATPTARPPTARPRTATQYTVECPACGKRFSRTKPDTTLRAHKAPDGWARSGRRGYLV